MISPSLQKLLDQLPTGDLEFARLLEAVERSRFSGPLTIDFFNGRPRQINLGQPVKLTICTGDSGERLDSRGGK
jgi:hypothetical protein